MDAGGLLASQVFDEELPGAAEGKSSACGNMGIL